MALLEGFDKLRSLQFARRPYSFDYSGGTHQQQLAKPCDGDECNDDPQSGGVTQPAKASPLKLSKSICVNAILFFLAQVGATPSQLKICTLSPIVSNPTGFYRRVDLCVYQ